MDTVTESDMAITMAMVSFPDLLLPLHATLAQRVQHGKHARIPADMQ